MPILTVDGIEVDVLPMPIQKPIKHFRPEIERRIAAFREGAPGYAVAAA